jgi:hypothetical protein
MTYVGLVVQNTPVWVYGIFALLLYLGLSRLRPRRSHLLRALLAPLAFFVWSLWSAVSAATTSAQPQLVGLIWLALFLLGWWSCRFATVVPLAAYMLLFWTRFGLEVWAGFAPWRASALLLIGIGLSAATAGRTWGDLLRLRGLMKPASPSSVVVRRGRSDLLA